MTIPKGTTLPAETITEFTILTAGSNPEEITAGPDGNLWFTEHDAGNRIGQISPVDVTTSSDVVVPANALITTPDGTTYSAGMRIPKGTILPAGTVTEFAIPTPGSAPISITTGPDGNLWFTEGDGNKIGRITPAGVITEFASLSSGSSPTGITAGPDSNLWFTEYGANKIGRINSADVVTAAALVVPANAVITTPGGTSYSASATIPKGTYLPAGTITEFASLSSGSNPLEITAGPDGNLWFTELYGNKIGRITPAGILTEFAVPTSNAGPTGITAGPDGSLWFTESPSNRVGGAGVGKLGRITPTGVITEFAIPTSSGDPTEITAGPDGNLWFTEPGANKIGRATIPDPSPSGGSSSSPAGPPMLLQSGSQSATPGGPSILPGSATAPTGTGDDATLAEALNQLYPEGPTQPASDTPWRPRGLAGWQLTFITRLGTPCRGMSPGRRSS